jgi:hypothetical protein
MEEKGLSACGLDVDVDGVDNIFKAIPLNTEKVQQICAGSC